LTASSHKRNTVEEEGRKKEKENKEEPKEQKYFAG
jgi:hypothetical protein